MKEEEEEVEVVEVKVPETPRNTTVVDQKTHKYLHSHKIFTLFEVCELKY